MLCFLCGEKIGFFRSLVDQQYCSAQHRAEARLVSAQALREEEDQELWSVAKTKAGKPSASVGQTASILAFLIVGVLIVAANFLPGPSAPRGPVEALDPTEKKGMWDSARDSVANVIRSQAPVTLREDFSHGLSDWTTATIRNAAARVDDPKGLALPSNDPSIVHPGSLRIWNRSTSLENYQMEFMGGLEKKSLSWAFRAGDARNYYATKVMIVKPGPLPNAALVRYVMMNGREWDRVQLPIPVTLERGGNYRVRVSVQDDRFITYLNGQVISSWSDKRLHRGGVGFFADDDDPQKVAWVSLSERDSFLGKMLAHFSLIVMPGASLE
ncbi:MAG TPA: hypothetical protein VMT15_04130 [Bryobacteraceae bacterium]|nr:hypothetical protein [Bryobacteraceae bacterium]